MLFNDVCVTAYSDAFGTRSYRRSNDNVAMLQNVMESLTGSRMLASIRNRVPMSRPLTKINTLKAEAELKYKNRILELERDFTEAQARLNALRHAGCSRSGGAAERDAVISAESRFRAPGTQRDARKFEKRSGQS